MFCKKRVLPTFVGRSARSYASPFRETHSLKVSLPVWPIPSWLFKPRFWPFLTKIGVFDDFRDGSKSEKFAFFAKFCKFDKNYEFWPLSVFSIFQSSAAVWKKLKKHSKFYFALQKKYFIKICMGRVKFCARKLFSTILFSAKKKSRKNFLVNRISQFVMFFAQFFSMGFVFRKKITNGN